MSSLEISFSGYHPRNAGIVNVTSSADLWLLRDLFRGLTWHGVRKLARCLEGSVGYGNGLVSFGFDDDVEPDETSFDGVRFSHAVEDDELVLSRRQLDGVAVQFLDVLVDGAVDRGIPAEAQEWWEELSSRRAAIRSRLT